MSCPHYQLLTCEFMQARSDKTETATRNAVLSTLHGYTSLGDKRPSSKLQSDLPRVLWNPTLFLRTRSLFLTAFTMMQSCLQVQSLNCTTDVNETCHFSLKHLCNLYIHRGKEMGKYRLRRIEWIYYCLSHERRFYN